MVRNKSILGIFIIVLSILFSCSQSGKTIRNMAEETVTINKTLKQNKDDLLAGVHSSICYSGFRSGQHPDRGDGAKNPSDREILEDLKIIQDEMKFKQIRLYDSGENSKAVLRLIRDNHIDIKVMLGIWLNAELSAHETCEWLTEPIPQQELDENKQINLLELQRGIELAREYPEIIVAVSVGNEALVEWNDHKVHADTIISYVERVQNKIQQPVTVADNYEWWAAHGEKLASVVDFICIHVYPVWEGKDIDEGLSYSIDNIMKVRNALPGAKIVIGEAGWATTASEFGDRASEEKQLQYYNDLMAKTKEMNITTFFFEAFDEDWKGNTNNPMGAEKHWGLYTVDRTPKLIMK